GLAALVIDTFLFACAGGISARADLGQATLTVTPGLASVSGSAQCGSVPLPGATLQLFNGAGLVAATTADAAAQCTLPPAATVDECLYRQDQSAWFKVPIQPGSKVKLSLTNLPANYDLTLYKDIATAYQAVGSSPNGLTRLSAEFAPDAGSSDGYASDAYSPDAYSPDAYSPDAYSPDAYSPDAYSPDAYSPDAY